MWTFGLLLGAASAGFFGTNAYLGSLLAARGEGGALPSVLFYFNLTQVAGSLAMIVLAGALVGRRWPVVLVAGVLPFAVLGAATTQGACFWRVW